MNQQTVSSLALALAGLLSPFVTGTAGCSLELGPGPADAEALEAELPPLLEWKRPHEGIRYSRADDVRPDEPGLQLDFEVWVNDMENGVWMEDLFLHTPNGPIRADVRDSLNARRVARFEAITVPSSTAGLSSRFVASMHDDIAEATDAIDRAIIGAVEPDAACAGPTTQLAFDLVVTRPEDLAPLAGRPCVELHGDVVVEAADIGELGALSGLSEVHGDVLVRANVDLATLSGLWNVRSIDGDLTIEDNTALPTQSEALVLRDRVGMQNIGGVVRIVGNGPG